MTIEVDDFLAHFGVKGMKWGVRKDRENKPLTRNQKIAIAGASAAVLAGGIAVGIILRNNHATRVAEMAIASEKAKKASEAALKKAAAMAEIQTDIIHSTRGKNIGFIFLNKGGVSDPTHIWEKMGGKAEGVDENFIRRVGDKVAVTFMDPEGRTDRAGRLIPHEVIVPFPLSSEIKDLSDVHTKVWPKLKDAYDDFYATSLKDPIRG